MEFLKWFKAIPQWCNDLKKIINHYGLWHRSSDDSKEFCSLFIMHHPFFRNPKRIL